jgi:hypothetical protein
MVCPPFGKIFYDLWFLKHFGHLLFIGLLLFGYPHFGRGDRLFTGEREGRNRQLKKRIKNKIVCSIGPPSKLVQGASYLRRSIFSDGTAKSLNN